MSYLDIVRKVARLSGTIDAGSVTSVAGRGRIATVAELVAQAWREMQLRHTGWHFMVYDIPEGVSVPSGYGNRDTPVRSAAELGIVDPPLRRWLTGSGSGTLPLTVWPADDRAQELALASVEWASFAERYLTGLQRFQESEGQPQVVAVDPRERLRLWPVPDTEYRLAGTYLRQPQTLAADGDEPHGIAEADHDAIVWEAYALLLEHDEPTDRRTIMAAQRQAAIRMDALRAAYLDPPRLSYD